MLSRWARLCIGQTSLLRIEFITTGSVPLCRGSAPARIPLNTHDVIESCFIFFMQRKACCLGIPSSGYASGRPLVVLACRTCTGVHCQAARAAYSPCACRTDALPGVILTLDYKFYPLSLARALIPRARSATRCNRKQANKQYKFQTMTLKHTPTGN